MNTISQRNAKEAFSKFSPFIQNYIYQSGWTDLRRVQIEAAIKIFNTENHLLITSETASGKTEAALFPILSMMEKESPENFQVLYISPLKALINDQFSRMKELLEESGMPVFRWHGDVSQNQKEAFLKNPSGLLQMTPESLEGMLLHRCNDIPRIFRNLKFIIIDEVHALFGSDRGAQILCQIQRIAKLIAYEPRRIALSATIGNAEAASKWLSGGSLRKTEVIEIKTETISWKLGLEHFHIGEQTEKLGVDVSTAYIYQATRKDKCIIFSNSREETEQITASLRQLAIRKKEPERFYIHHGNLSAAIREEAEEKLKTSEEPITVCATATLELGIDIGKLKRVINQGAPTSVSGFLQRLGRSGRRGECPEMLMVFREDEILPNAPIYQLIPWELLQGIAVIELYRQERWLEPTEMKPMPTSLLFHQTLSILAGNGSLSAATLAKEVLTLSPFANISKENYKTLLMDMLKKEFIELTEEKELIVGLKGERLLSSFKFFAVFKDSEDFTVRCGTEEIGSITAAPPIGEHFALAGRVWEVEELDITKRLIFAKAVVGKLKVSWPGSGGYIHSKVLEKMRDILCSEDSYPYLLPKAAERLKIARTLAHRTNLCKKCILNIGGNSYVFLPWLGTRAFQTMKRILQRKMPTSLGIYDIQSAGCYYITFKSEKGNETAIINALKEINESDTLLLSELVAQNEYPSFDKYDPYLPHSLLLQSYTENHLCLIEAEYRISTL